MRRTVRGLVLAVAGASALMLLTARFAGRMAAGRAARPPAAGEPRDGAPAASEAGAADLTFYALGTPRSGTAPPPGAAPLPPGAASPSVAGGAYVVQVMATRDGAAARRLRDHLGARGLPATLVEGRAGALPIYRVRVGRYRDRAGAEAVLKRLRGVPGVTPWILREAD